jgi:hypothetical protein
MSKSPKGLTLPDQEQLVKTMRETNITLEDCRARMAEPDAEVYDGPVNTLADYEGALAMVLVVGREVLRKSGWTDDRINSAISTGRAFDGSRLN